MFIWNSTKTIEELMEVNPKSTSWRTNAEHFRSASDCRHAKPGTVSFALAWYQQGMAVNS